MKSIFEEMGGTYRQVSDYLIPNLVPSDAGNYRIGKYGRMRRSYLKEHRPILYTNLLASGMLHRHLAEIDQACNERMEIIVSAMAKQDGVTEALKAADQMEWISCMVVGALYREASRYCFMLRIGLLFSAKHFSTKRMWSAFNFINRLHTTSAGLSSPAMCSSLRLVAQVSTSKSTIW